MDVSYIFSEDFISNFIILKLTVLKRFDLFVFNLQLFLHILILGKKMKFTCNFFQTFLSKELCFWIFFWELNWESSTWYIFNVYISIKNIMEILFNLLIKEICLLIMLTH